MLGCYGSGKADKFAEVCAGVVLAGEISLGCAGRAGDWAPADERYGRNRPPNEAASQQAAKTSPGSEG